MNERPAVRDAVDADIPAILEIHRRSLAGDVFPSLGEHFLRRYYQHVLLSDSSFLFVATNDGQVNGFVCVSLRQERLVDLARPRDLVTFAMNCVRRPALVVSAAVQLRKMNHVSDADASEISFLAVRERCRGKGLGRLLLARAMTVSKDEGKHYIRTKTSNPRLATFYENEFAAVAVDSFAVLGRVFNVLKWKL